MRAHVKLVAAAGVLATAGFICGCGGGSPTGDTAASAPAGAPAAAKAAAQYYCEMHPDVVSSNPGTCPRCQMALKRR
jgi:hypothetical protein